MRYKDYPDYEETYIIHHNTGYGVMESLRVEHGIVASCSTLEEANNICEELTRLNNSAEDIKSSWIENTYSININTCTDEGKKLLKEFHIQTDKLFKEIKDNPELYNTYTTKDGYIIHLQKHSMFDDSMFDDK